MSSLITQFYEFFIKPFSEFQFLRLSLLSSIGIGLGCAPLGVFMILRRMSLMGDSLSHAILPGVGLAYILFGFSQFALLMGGLTAGLVVSFLSIGIQKQTTLKEDSSFAALYLIALALGVILISSKGSGIDLMHILFGQPLAATQESTLVSIITGSITFLVLLILYRLLVLEIFDPIYFESVGGNAMMVRSIFIFFVVLNLVIAFQNTGTLMSIGQMILPAVTTKLFFKDLKKMLFMSILFSVFGGYLGLLCSFHFDLPGGPATILVLGFFYFLALLFSPTEGLVFKVLHLKHLKE
jgi:zinc/manganese transport system permease protein